MNNTKEVTKNMAQKSMDKKGQGFNLLMGGIVSFVVIGVMIVVGININSTLGANYAVNSAERNASNAVTAAFGTFTQYFTILALVIIAAVILYFLLRNLGSFGGGMS